MLKNIFKRLFNNAFEYNKRNILELLKSEQAKNLCDLGCDDGLRTIELAKKTKIKEVFGVEVDESQAKKALERGVKVEISDLNNSLPFSNGFFDIVHANQVIEHLYDTDKFVEEIHRVLKKGGVAIISTENLASWHNIFALLFGWQPFSSTNISSKSIGNPLAIWTGRQDDRSSWQHHRIFSYRGLKELFEDKGFVVEKILGAGYYPWPAFFGNLDKRHCHFMTFKIKKI